MAGLPVADEVALARSIAALSNGEGPVQVDKYENGMWRVRHTKSAYQGRAIMTIIGNVGIIVLVYKKEGDRVPSRVLSAARKRIEEAS